MTHARYFLSIYQLPCSAWNSQSIPENEADTVSADETIQRDELWSSLQRDRLYAWLLCGNPDHLLTTCPFPPSQRCSTLCNPRLAAFSLSTPPVQLSYVFRKGRKEGKIKKGQWLRSPCMSSGHLTRQMWGSPSVHTGDLNSHQHERVHTVLCWQIPAGWLRTQPLMTKKCRQTGAMLLLNSPNQARRKELHHLFDPNTFNLVITTQNDI